MVNRYVKEWGAVFSGGLVWSLMLFFVATGYASQGELENIRHEILAKGRQWVAAENHISRMPDNDRKMRLGLLKPMKSSVEPASPDFSTGATAVTPPSFDWRNNNYSNYVSGIRDQGNCGSCWAFATTAALESNILIATGLNPYLDLAEQILVSCSSAGSCSGGYIDIASNFIRDTGLPVESDYPYTATNGRCADALAGWQNATSRITSWHYVGNTTNPSLEQIKNELVTYGPLVTTFDVYSDFYYYTGGVYTYTSGSYQGGHAVLIVGYDDPGQYFIVKNSWGDWGESGYFRIGYSEMNNNLYFGDWSQAYHSDTTLPSISVATPNGSESWAAGTTKTIQWDYTGSPGTTVRIDLYNDVNLISTLASAVSIGTGGAGSYSWNIPQALVAGSSYKIAVTSNQNSSYTDLSDNFFTITPYASPTISLLSPNGGESFTRNTIQRITWEFTGDPGTYAKIELLNGAAVSTITSKASIAAGGYNWKISPKQVTGADYKIRITSKTNSLYTDTSDNSFAIKSK